MVFLALNLQRPHFERDASKKSTKKIQLKVNGCQTTTLRHNNMPKILKSKRKLENSVENKKCLFHYSKIISNFQSVKPVRV